MAATPTVTQSVANPQFRPQSELQSDPAASETPALITPRHGVVTLFGYGISACLDHGHLVLKDGIGPLRREARLPRVGHGLRRLVVIGADGMVSLSALHWLADQNAAFVMLERDGHVLTTTGPVQPSDARLRRAQALAVQSGLSLQIAQKLISEKLSGQEQVVRHKLLNPETASAIERFRGELPQTDSTEAVRFLEAQGGRAYWSAWANLPIQFPRNDLPRVPTHWRTFGARMSPLSASPRLAVNPPNAMLNYLYALLESEARLAAAALGLDPGLGVLHADLPYRDSLACDLMEPVRPQVDAFVLDWITSQPLKREWFFEQRNGNCRLMGSFAARLSETAQMWGRAIAPHAESVAHALSLTVSQRSRTLGPATRLTQRRKRESKGGYPSLPNRPAPKPLLVCSTCGKAIARGSTECAHCSAAVSTAHLVEAAKRGRVAANGAVAQARRAEAQRRHAAALKNWRGASQPARLDEETYIEAIQPRLASLTNATIASALGVCMPYAADIRRGRRIPHPRHWQALAELVGFSKDA